MRGEPNQRPNAASSAAPRFWSRNTSTGCSANTRPIQAKVASSSGLERSMSNASVPSSSPSGRSWGELVMGGPPTLSPERCDWGTGSVLRRAAVEKPDDRHCRLLRARRERPRRYRATEQRDEIAPLHVEHGELPPLCAIRQPTDPCARFSGTSACQREPG